MSPQDRNNIPIYWGFQFVFSTIESEYSLNQALIPSGPQLLQYHAWLKHTQNKLKTALINWGRFQEKIQHERHKIVKFAETLLQTQPDRPNSALSTVPFNTARNTLRAFMQQSDLGNERYRTAMNTALKKENTTALTLKQQLARTSNRFSLSHYNQFQSGTTPSNGESKHPDFHF